jgi:hypothetical protein
MSPTLEPANHERVVIHRFRELEHPIQLGIVVVHRAPEARPDGLLAGGVELPPRAFEVQHGAMAVREATRRIGHRTSLA